jgi:hypothetical protein
MLAIGLSQVATAITERSVNLLRTGFTPKVGEVEHLTGADVKATAQPYRGDYLLKLWRRCDSDLD